MQEISCRWSLATISAAEDPCLLLVGVTMAFQPTGTLGQWVISRPKAPARGATNKQEKKRRGRNCQNWMLAAPSAAASGKKVNCQRIWTRILENHLHNYTLSQKHQLPKISRNWRGLGKLAGNLKFHNVLETGKTFVAGRYQVFKHFGGNLSQMWLCHSWWCLRDNVQPCRWFFNCISEIFVFLCQIAALH